MVNRFIELYADGGHRLQRFQISASVSLQKRAFRYIYLRMLMTPD